MYEFENLLNDDYITVAGLMKGLQNYNVDAEKRKERVIFNGIASEVRLIQRLMEIGIADTDSVEEQWRWFRQADIDRIKIENLPEDTLSMDISRQRLPKPGPFLAYNKLVLNHVQMKEPTYKYIASLVLRSTIYPDNNNTDGTATLQQAIQTNVQQFSSASATVRKFSSDKGQRLLKKLTNVMMSNALSRFQYTVPFMTFSIGVMIDCIMLKAIMPRWLMDEESIQDIDNYLAIHLGPAIGSTITLDPQHVMNGNINQLKLLYDGNSIRGIGAFNDVRDFLYTSDTGDGWGTGGDNETVNFTDTTYTKL